MRFRCLWISTLVAILSLFGSEKVDAFELFSSRSEWESAVSGIRTENFDASSQNSLIVGSFRIESVIRCLTNFNGISPLQVIDGIFSAPLGSPVSGDACNAVSVSFSTRGVNLIPPPIAFGFDVIQAEGDVFVFGDFDFDGFGDFIDLPERLSDGIDFFGLLAEAPLSGFTFTGAGEFMIDNLSIGTELNEAPDQTTVPESRNIIGTIAMLGLGLASKRKSLEI